MSDSFSVIIRVKNEERWVGHAIQSSLDFLHGPQIVVIDNKSTDNSVKIAHEVLSETSMHYSILSEKEQGVSHARNLGIKHASGSYICFLDVDDRLLPGSISSRANYLTETTSAVTFGGYNRLTGNVVKRIIVPEKVTYRKLLRKNYIPNLTAMYNAEKIGKYYQDPVGHEDYDMWLRVLSNAEHATSCSKHGALAEYNDNVAGISANKFKAAIWHWRILKRHIRNPIIRLVFFANYIISGILSRL